MTTETADARMSAYAAEGRRVLDLIAAGVCIHDSTMVVDVRGRDAHGMLDGTIECRDCTATWANHAAYADAVAELVA